MIQMVFSTYIFAVDATRELFSLKVNEGVMIGKYKDRRRKGGEREGVSESERKKAKVRESEGGSQCDYMVE